MTGRPSNTAVPQSQLWIGTLEVRLGERILDVAVSTERTNVRVWTNDSNEPDHVVIGVR